MEIENTNVKDFAYHKIQKAKSTLVEESFNAFLPIFGRFRTVVYLDLFAGKGTYKDDETEVDGTCINVIKNILNHTYYPGVQKVYCYLYELEFYEELKKKILTIPQFKERDDNTLITDDEKVVVIIGRETSKNEVESLLDKLDPSTTALFSFVDPYDYSFLDFEMMVKLLSFEISDMVLNFKSSFINRFKIQQWETIQSIFNMSDEQYVIMIKEINDSPQKLEELTEYYIKQLKDRVNNLKNLKIRVRAFDINQEINHLILFSKNRKGIETQKNALWKIVNQIYPREDILGFDLGFRASNGNIRINEDGFHAQYLPDTVKKYFEDNNITEVSIDDLEEHIVTETVFKFKKRMLKNILIGIRNPERKKLRNGTFPQGTIVSLRVTH